jgi:hypothetical protein
MYEGVLLHFCLSDEKTMAYFAISLTELELNFFSIDSPLNRGYRLHPANGLQIPFDKFICADVFNYLPRIGPEKIIDLFGVKAKQPVLVFYSETLVK